ncbi:MAG: hypothetical protein OdinLCB4_001085 [Candidatus Odinarchaeum yellowstonii]|uniref:Uncharacterized protein n=1 Tax=Odinarchaeota yellowstonii (strain LCB_4) TaxID=1841599 RepID=A0AAF0IBM9_ODILC|nr:MAG: hypothetical protein OdinLCB4_001085 [Candidatus Odinarchaeum yellowstonii]
MSEWNFSKSLEAARSIAKTLVARKLSGDIALITYDDNIVYDSKNLQVTCSQILAYIAQEEAVKGRRILLCLNLSSVDKTLQELLNNLKKIFVEEHVDSAILFFGETPDTQIGNHIKIDLDWLGANPAYLTEIISETSIKKTEFDLKKLCYNKTLSHIDELSNILIKNLGPPSLIEDLSLKVVKEKPQVKADEAASIAAGVGSFIIASSPTLLLLKGLKYISSLYNLLKQRHDEKTRRFLEKWAEEVSEGYSAVKLVNFFEKGISEYLKTLFQEKKIVILVNLTFNTMYDLFYPVLLYNILDVINSNNILLEYMFLDNISYLAKTDFFIKLFQEKLIREDKKFILTVSLSTKNPVNAKNTELILKYFSTRCAVYFDIAADHLPLLIAGQPLSEIAQILQSFADMKKLKDEQILTAIYFNTFLTPSWEIIKIPLKLTHKFKLLIKR